MPEPQKNGASADGSKNFMVELRQRALNRKAEALFDAAAGVDSHWLEELRIHQIELEIQNEELRLAQADLERSRARYFDLYDQAPAGYITIGVEGEIIEMNVRANALFGVGREGLTGHKFLHSIAVEDRDTYYLCRRSLLRTATPQSCELRMTPQNAAPFWARLEMSLGGDRGTDVSRIVMIDISERKTAEFQRRLALEELEGKEEELRRSLLEKETLLKEIHHRVKNNLQVVSSLLRLQGDLLADQDQEAASVLRDSERRIVSMAHIHEMLYGSDAMDRIDFADYTRTLVGDLMRSHGGSASPVGARLHVAPVFLSVDQAIPCGLILNELMTNALKYAYPAGSGGEITVSLSENAGGLVKLSVADGGVGLPQGFDWRNAKSMGLPIVDLLASQLGGVLFVRTNPGSTFTVEFPKENKAAKGQGA